MANRGALIAPTHRLAAAPHPSNLYRPCTAAAVLQHYLDHDQKLRKFVPLIHSSVVYPVIYDSRRTVLSLPPIINGQHSAVSGARGRGAVCLGAAGCATPCGGCESRGWGVEGAGRARCAHVRGAGRWGIGDRRMRVGRLLRVLRPERITAQHKLCYITLNPNFHSCPQISLATRDVLVECTATDLTKAKARAPLSPHGGGKGHPGPGRDGGGGGVVLCVRVGGGGWEGELVHCQCEVLVAWWSRGGGGGGGGGKGGAEGRGERGALYSHEPCRWWSTWWQKYYCLLGMLDTLHCTAKENMYSIRPCTAHVQIVLNTVVTMFSEYCSTPFEVEPVEVVDAFGDVTGE